MIETALAIATALGGLAALAYFVEKGYRPARTAWGRRLRSSLLGRGDLGTAKYRKRLLKFILADQDRSGHHRGQFGAFSVRDTDKAYYALSEPPDLKPRLWHTGVVADVLRSLPPSSEVDRALRRVRLGVESLTSNGWVAVGMGARKIMPAAHGSSSLVVSYRHTLRAMSILHVLDPQSKTVKACILWMIDHGDDAQTDGGGWRQCRTEFRDEDLWASAYALKLLGQVFCSSPSWLLPEAHKDLERRLRRTGAWMAEQWEKERWAYGTVRPQDNTPVILAEVAAALRLTHPEVVEAATSWLVDGLTANYHPSSRLLDSESIAGPSGTTARLAYALLRSNCEVLRHEVQALAHYAAEQEPAELDSAEAAMLLAVHDAWSSS